MSKSHLIDDLIWAVRSPPLIVMPGSDCQWYDSDFYRDLYDSSADWFAEMRRHPERVKALVAAQNDKRLGKLFETLWAAFLDESERFEIVEQNLQIIDGAKTLGELDLIVVDKKTKQMLHWELAVKFYLGFGDTRQWKNWFGPAKKDRLDLKMSHLINHQTNLSQHAAVKKVLKAKKIKIDNSAVILKGCLFYPPDSMDDETPQYANVDHCRSRWTRLSDLAHSFKSEVQFYPLIGEGWMASLDATHFEKMYSASEIINHIKSGGYRLPLLVSVIQQGFESEKIFIVQDDCHRQ